MKRKNKLIAVVVALAMCFSVMPTAAHATQDVTESGTYPVSVTIENYSDFSVRIPKSITMTPPEGSYTVYADCSYFAEGDTLKIVPDSSFELTCDSGGTVTATISQDTQEITEIGSYEITGYITTGSLSAGTWTGSFNFNIALESNLFTFTIDNQITNETLVYQAEKGMTWAEWIGSKYDTDDILYIGDEPYYYVEPTIKKTNYVYSFFDGSIALRADDIISEQRNYRIFNNHLGGAG